MAYEGIRRWSSNRDPNRGIGSLGSEEEREKNKKKRRGKGGVGGWSHFGCVGDKRSKGEGSWVWVSSTRPSRRRREAICWGGGRKLVNKWGGADKANEIRQSTNPSREERRELKPFGEVATRPGLRWTRQLWPRPPCLGKLVFFSPPSHVIQSQYSPSLLANNLLTCFWISTIPLK